MAMPTVRGGERGRVFDHALDASPGQTRGDNPFYPFQMLIGHESERICARSFCKISPSDFIYLTCVETQAFLGRDKELSHP